MHCILHRENLVAKKLQLGSAHKTSELSKVLHDVAKIVCDIKTKPKASRLFEKLCVELSSGFTTLIMHKEIR